MPRRTALAIVSVLTLDAVCAVAAAPAQLITSRPENSVAYAERWVDAILTHAPVTLDDDATAIAKWSADQVRGLLVELASIRQLMRDPYTNRFPVPIDLDGGRSQEIRYSRRERETLDRTADRIKAAGVSESDLIARAMVLHSDIAILGNGTGTILRFSDGQQMTIDRRNADHWLMSRTLAQLLKKNSERDGDVAVWYRATMAWMASVQLWSVAHVASAVDRFPDNADLRFLAGCMHEDNAAAHTQAAIAATRLEPGLRIRVQSPSGELQESASHLRRAVELNPALIDARIHYGRVLTLLGRPADAVSALRPAVAGAREHQQRYFAEMFLGAALEAVNDTAAGDAYRSAAALYPAAASPRLALSHLAAAAGKVTEARTALEPILAAPDDSGPRHDPWWTYFTSCGQAAPALLDDAWARLVTRRPQ